MSSLWLLSRFVSFIIFRPAERLLSLLVLKRFEVATSFLKLGMFC